MTANTTKVLKSIASVWGLALAVGAIALAGCGSVRATSHGDPVLLRGLDMPGAYAAGGQLYVVQRVMPPVNEIWNELMRVDPATGHVYAVRRLESLIDGAVLARGVLWVSTSRGNGFWLWRLDPLSLAVRSRQVLPGSSEFISYGTMALAGGWLWAASADRLNRISLATGALTATIPLPGSRSTDVAASPSGRILLVSEGGQSEGGDSQHVQRRDPQTGGLIASSGTLEAVISPYIGGVIDGGAWVSLSGGMMGYVERLDVATLKRTGFAGAMPHPWVGGGPDIWGTNGIRAQLIDGILWVSQIAGGPQRNYCGDPRSGISWAPIKLPSWGMFVTADANNVYYVPDVNVRREQLNREPIDPRCLARTAVAGRSSTR